MVFIKPTLYDEYHATSIDTLYHLGAHLYSPSLTLDRQTDLFAGGSKTSHAFKYKKPAQGRFLLLLWRAPGRIKVGTGSST